MVDKKVEKMVEMSVVMSGDLLVILMVCWKAAKSVASMDEMLD
jgi:hypothetical protein